MTLPEALPSLLCSTPRTFMMSKSTCFRMPNSQLPALAIARRNSSGIKIPFRFATSSDYRFQFPPPPRLAAHSPSSSSRVIVSDVDTRSAFERSGPTEEPHTAAEDLIEKAVYMCRFLAIFGVFGSLVGSVLCFVKGCAYVAASFMEYYASRGRVISMLVEALDVYLLGTVMLVFGMGLYELFISTLDIAQSPASGYRNRSNLFGMFTLMERPKWLEIKSVDELKTKVGHVIVMLLLIGLFDKIKKTAIHTPFDLLCFATSVLLSSGCLYLLSKLNGSS